MAAQLTTTGNLSDWPLFLIVWYPHSGGRWLNRGLLQRHPRVGMSEFFSPFLHHDNDALLRMDKTTQVHKARSLKPLEEEFTAAVHSVDAARRAGVASYLGDKRVLMARQFPDRHHGGVLPVGADVALPDLPLLFELLPRLKIVHLVRHPLGCFASLRSRLELDGNPFSISATWVALNAWLRILAEEMPERFLRVRLEDLAADPPSQLQALCGWLGIPFDAAMLEGVGEYYGRNQDSGLARPLPERIRRVVMEIAGPEAERQGYAGGPG